MEKVSSDRNSNCSVRKNRNLVSGVPTTLKYKHFELQPGTGTGIKEQEWTWYNWYKNSGDFRYEHEK